MRKIIPPIRRVKKTKNQKIKDWIWFIIATFFAMPIIGYLWIGLIDFLGRDPLNIISVI